MVNWTRVALHESDVFALARFEHRSAGVDAGRRRREARGVLEEADETARAAANVGDAVVRLQIQAPQHLVALPHFISVAVEVGVVVARRDAVVVRLGRHAALADACEGASHRWRTAVSGLCRLQRWMPLPIKQQYDT